MTDVGTDATRWAEKEVKERIRDHVRRSVTVFEKAAAAGKAPRASDQLGETEVSVDRWLVCGHTEGVASGL